jgi:glyoxylase-like metal-dependent hydrolase (beta-lactamase superfamily II)
MSLHKITDKITIIDSPINGRKGTLGTYLISGERNALIDPGPSTQTLGVIDALHGLKITDLQAILLTHIHLDHGGGSWMLLEEYPESYLHCHPKGAEHMINPTQLKEGALRLFGDRIQEYGRITGVDEKRVRESRDGEVIDLGGIHLETIWTPGHSSHSQSYFEPDSRTAFVGDAVGHTMGENGPIIPVSPPPHNPEQAIQSIEKIDALKPEIICIAHFGAHYEPEKHLNRIKERTKLWRRLALKAVDEKMKLDNLVDLVLIEDEELIESVKMGEGANHSIKASLLGFYLYAKWMRGKN